MPFDSEVTRLQGEISQLEKEIAAIQTSISYVVSYNPLPLETTKTLTGIITRLQDSLEHKELKLSMHRQRTKESGVKY